MLCREACCYGYSSSSVIGSPGSFSVVQCSFLLVVRGLGLGGSCKVPGTPDQRPWAIARLLRTRELPVKKGCSFPLSNVLMTFVRENGTANRYYVGAFWKNQPDG